MKKITASQIESYLYEQLQKSTLKTAINGQIYLDGLRPPNSQKEDVVVSFLTGIFTDFRQIGKVNINAYVPNKISNGVGTKDTRRCREMERLLQHFADDLPTDAYRWKPSRIILTFPEPSIGQHFVNLQLEFLYNTL